jgi:hypothetical protein
LVLASFALFLASYFGSSFMVGEVYHYFRLNRLSPAWLAAVVCAAAGVGAARGGPRLALVLLLAVAFATGASDVVRVAEAGAGGTRSQRWEILTRFKGYEYRYWSGMVVRRTELSHGDRARVLLAFREDARDWLSANAGEQGWRGWEGSIDDAIREAWEVDPSGKLLLGFGLVMKRKLENTLPVRVEWVTTRPERERDLLEEAAGRFGNGWIFSESQVRAELEQMRDAKAGDAFWRGFGWRLFDALGDQTPGVTAYWQSAEAPLWAKRSRAVEFVAREEPRIAKPVLEGYDAARAAHAIPR